MIIDRVNRAVSFTGRIRPRRFNSHLSWTKHHHFIVWKDGRAAPNALIASDESDLEIHDALLELGAVAGNTLSIETWTERRNRSNSEPDKSVAGSPIDVLISPNLRADDIFIDAFGKGFQFRFGGHRALIDVWKSGCVVCLQSCPGGKIGNAAYTMRDYALGKSTFALNRKNLPSAESPVVVTLKLIESV